MVRHSLSILLLKTHDLFYLSYYFTAANSNLEVKYLAADENYSHTNVNFLYASITLLKKESFKYLWWDTAFMKNIIQKQYYVFTSLLIGQTVNR